MALKKNSLKNILIISVILVIVIGICFFLFKGKKTQSYKSPVPAVCIQKPVIGTVIESVTISGYVEAKAMIPVVPFVSGTIMEYPAHAGDFVTKDTLLARIDDAPFKQQFLQAQAAYLGYQSTFDRVSTLFKANATTQQNYDSAKAQKDAAKAQYDLAKLQLDYTQVKAPVDGTILIADLAVGSIGTQSQPVAVIADLSDQVVRLKVPEKYFDLFQLKKENINVTVTRPGQKGMYDDAITTCTIENIAPYVSPESKNFQVVCHLDNPGERFRPGMYVKVTASYNIHKDVPILPIKARKLDGSCYIYDSSTNKVSYIEIKDIISDNKNFIVPEKYHEAYFVTDGQNSVFDGQQVNVINTDEVNQ